MTTVYVMGDSFAVTNGGFAAPMAAMLGWDLTMDAEGGSGYGVAPTFASRLPALITAAPDVAIIEGGGNDWSGNTTPVPEFTTLVGEFYTALRAALPSVRLYVTGAHRMGQGWFDALVAATVAAGGTFIDWGDVVEVERSAATRWLTGTGKVGSPAGDGNRDEYLSADGIHPTASGCAYIGSRMAQELGVNRVASINLQSGVPLMLEIPA